MAPALSVRRCSQSVATQSLMYSAGRSSSLRQARDPVRTQTRVGCLTASLPSAPGRSAATPKVPLIARCLLVAH
jgi:hypothetical protein